MLVRRLASAAVGIPLLLLTVIAGGLVYDVVLAAILAAATAEFLFQAGVAIRNPLLWLAAAAAAALPLAAGAPPGTTSLVLSLFLLLALLAAVRSASARIFEPWSLVVAVAMYVGWLGRYFGLLRHAQDGRALVLLLLLVTFASDTGAYAVGRLLGRHRLAPRISPGKTIEGAAGGLAAAALVAMLAGRLLALPYELIRLFALGFVMSIAAQLGDLAESALKRRLEMKDAGHLLPGHGGLLDRLDSLLFAGAVLYYAVRWMSL